MNFLDNHICIIALDVRKIREYDNHVQIEIRKYLYIKFLMRVILTVSLLL